MSPLDTLPSLATIGAAQQRIGDHVHRTDLVPSRRLSERSGAEVYLKLENQQPTGSFKVRGACNAVQALLQAGPMAGVTTASTGNHARAVAYMARRFGLSTRAFVSGSVSEQRVAALESSGAQVDRSSADQTEAIAAAEEYALAHGYGFIPPFDHPDVISGQGTVGLELCDQLAAFDAVVVPVSGGGLVSGVGLAVKSLRPDSRVIGVCAQTAPAMAESLAAGRPVAVPELPSVAESLMGDLGPDNQFTFRIAESVVDEVVTVSDASISAATALLAEEGLRVEEAAAASTAYLLGRRWSGERVVLLVTGGA